MNLDNSCKKRNIGINGCFHCYVEYKCIPYINSGAIPVFLFLFYGSPSPIVGNKDKMGGSALFAKIEIGAFGASGQIK